MIPRWFGLRAGFAASIAAAHVALRLSGAGLEVGMLSGTSEASALALAFVLSWFGLVVAAPALTLSLLLEALARRVRRARGAHA